MKILLLAVAVLAAESSGLSSLKTWFKHLRDGLTESSVSELRQKKRGVAAVAAVRGSEQQAVEADKPAWKTGARGKKAEANRKERAELAAAIDKILEGKTRDGLEALETFAQAHPDSKLISEVREALGKAKELDASAPEPEKPAAVQSSPAEEKPAEPEKK